MPNYVTTKEQREQLLADGYVLLAVLASNEDEINSILSLWEPPIPAVYCHHAVETEDYPVPSDLRAQTPEWPANPTQTAGRTS